MYVNEFQKILRVINNVQTVLESQNYIEPCTLSVFLCAWEKNMRKKIICRSFPYCSLTPLGKWAKGSIQRFPLVDVFSLICLTTFGTHFYFWSSQHPVRMRSMYCMKRVCSCLCNYALCGTSRGSTPSRLCWKLWRLILCLSFSWWYTSLFIPTLLSFLFPRLNRSGLFNHCGGASPYLLIIALLSTFFSPTFFFWICDD